MILADLHTHTKLCRHADGEPEEYLAEACARKLKFFGVSDHFPAPAGFDALYRMKQEELPLYRKTVMDLKERSQQTGGPEVFYSCEIDYVPGRMQEVFDLVHQEPFDYIIGSIHEFNGFAFDDFDQIERWKEIGTDRVWETYLDMLLELVSGYPVQIIGHSDLPKKFGFQYSDRKKLLARMAEIYRIAAEKNICVELNTSGLRAPVGEMYPAMDLLKLAHDAGCGLTFGSDAHKPCLVGVNFMDAVEAAEAAGFRAVRIFRRGIPEELPFRSMPS